MTPEHWTVDEALAAASRLRIASVPRLEEIDLLDAAGRALGRDVVAPIDLPPHANAAMDGIAWAHRGESPPGPLRCIGTLAAGDPAGGITPGPGDCVRIMTGAALPSSCDTVTPIESCRVDGTLIEPLERAARGAHVRQAGEDLARGALALAAGRRIGPAEIGLLAALGLDRVAVRARLRVAVLSTGKELARAGDAASAGIFDSNAPMLVALLRRLGVEARAAGTVDDDPDRLVEAVWQAADSHDVVVTSGGTGAGSADHATALERLGTLRSAHVALKPGRPLALGEIAQARGPVPLFCLPGNPVAALVACLLFVRPRVLAWQGFAPRAPDRFRLAIVAPVAKRAGRVEVLRGRWQRDHSDLRVALDQQQGSGMIGSIGAADCLVVLEHARGPIEAGEWVDVWPLAGLLA